MESAIAMIQLNALKTSNDFDNRDNELARFLFDMPNREVLGLAYYMVVAWYEPRVNSLEHTTMFWGSKDERWTDQKKHWEETRHTQEYYRVKARKFFRNYSSRNNSYLSGE